MGGIESVVDVEIYAHDPAENMELTEVGESVGCDCIQVGGVAEFSRELLLFISNDFDAHVGDAPWWLILTLIRLKFMQHLVVSGTTYKNIKDHKEASDVILGRIFPEGVLLYDVLYSGRRRQLIVVCSQWIMPSVSILTALHCFNIFPEDSGRRRRLIVVCSQWKVISINILAALHCLNVANGFLFRFAHMLVGAWSSACPPGRIGPGKSWKMCFPPGFLSTYVEIWYKYRMESEMASTVTKGMDFSPFRVLTL